MTKDYKFKKKIFKKNKLLRSEHVYLFHLLKEHPKMINLKSWYEYTCLNCGINIRFDPEFNPLYDYPIVVSDEDLRCVL